MASDTVAKEGEAPSVMPCDMQSQNDVSNLNDRCQGDECHSNGTCVILANVDNVQQLEDVRDAIATSPATAQYETSRVVVLGNLWSSAAHVTVMEHLATLLRTHNLHSNERQTLISYDDSLVVTQLCLAEHSKETLGDYDVATSAVVEMHRQLVADKLAQPTHIACDDRYMHVRRRYDEFMRACNLLDWMDLHQRITAELPNNQTLATEIQQTTFLICNCSPNPVERALVNLLAGDKPCLATTLETSLDDSLLNNATVVFQPCKLSSRLATATGRIMATPGNQQTSASQVYAERILMSYLHLLINMRSELALAQVFNVPERKLDHAAFTAVKREARNKRMSMYQTLSSFVMRLRLGGKGYRPDAENPLAPHVKGIGELMDLMHKLSNIVEEVPDHRAAVRRVLNTIRNTIVRCRDERMRKQSVEHVSERLQRLAEHTLALQQEACLASPGRDSHNGGSQVGRHTLRAIRAMVDKHACVMTSHSCTDVLTDVFSSQTTPLRFQAVVSKFRSPEEVSPGSRESQSLAERMGAQVTQQPKRCAVPRYQATMDWALPVHQVGLKTNQMEDGLIDYYIPSKTLVVAGAKSRPLGGSTARKVLESLHDQENVTSQSCDPASCDKPSFTNHSRAENPQAESKKVSKKRKSDDDQVTENKKAKKTVASRKKKPVPLLKGQKQLTAFFRV